MLTNDSFFCQCVKIVYSSKLFDSKSRQHADCRLTVIDFNKQGDFMRKVLVAVFAVLISTQAFAYTPVTVRLEALGFILTDLRDAPSDEAGESDLEICDSENKCLQFNVDRTQKAIKGVEVLKEKNNLCTITVQPFSKSFRDSKATDDFMLDVSGYVVKQIKGSGDCTLTQKDLRQQRSLTGIYL